MSHAATMFHPETGEPTRARLRAQTTADRLVARYGPLEAERRYSRRRRQSNEVAMILESWAGDARYLMRQGSPELEADREIQAHVRRCLALEAGGSP